MKSTPLILLISVLLVKSGFSQLSFSNKETFTWLDSTAMVKSDIEITNSGNYPINLEWQLIESTLQDSGHVDGAWKLQFCDCNACYGNDFWALPNQGVCNFELSPGASNTWFVSVDLNGLPANNAKWQIEVLNVQDGVKDTLTYYFLADTTSSGGSGSGGSGNGGGNGGGSGSGNGGSVSVNSINTVHYVQSFPNPSDNVLNISYSIEVGKSEIEVYNLVGTLIERVELRQAKGEVLINTSNYENGMYFYVLKSDENVVKSSKFNVLH